MTIEEYNTETMRLNAAFDKAYRERDTAGVTKARRRLLALEFKGYDGQFEKGLPNQSSSSS